MSNSGIENSTFSTQYHLTQLRSIKYWVPNCSFRGLPKGFALARRPTQSHWGLPPQAMPNPGGRFRKIQSCICGCCACTFLSRLFAVHRSCFDSSKPICKMGLARLYWRTHPFSKVSESKLPTTKKKTQAAAQVLNCSTYWNLSKFTKGE